MRLRPARPDWVVDASSGDPGRPVRFEILGLTFVMTTTEAVSLATRLADTVQAINQSKERSKP